ncbi:unnamed protein product [Rhodiola kirilowii]
MAKLEAGGDPYKQALTLAPIKTRNGHVVDEYGMKQEVQPLSPMARLFHKPDSNVYIMAILASKCLIDPRHVKANMGDMVRAHPRFSCLQVVDEKKGGSAGMKWVNTEVNCEDHVIVPKINQTAIGSHAKYLEDYMYNLSKTTVGHVQAIVGYPYSERLEDLRSFESGGHYKDPPLNGRRNVP